jgi:hypothetical protein
MTSAPIASSSRGAMAPAIPLPQSATTFSGFSSWMSFAIRSM